jgi:hypothetical protein
MAEDLLHEDETLARSEPVAASSEIAREGVLGTLLGVVIGAVLGLVAGAVFFGFPTGGQASRDVTMFWVVLAIAAVAGAVTGFVFGGGRGVRDARRQAESEAHGRS